MMTNYNLLCVEETEMKQLYMYGNYMKDNASYLLYAVSNGSNIELIITNTAGNIQSAYKTEDLMEYSFCSSEAKELWGFIKTGIKKCSNKKVSPAPVTGLGTVKRYTIEKGNTIWSIDKYNGQFSGCEAQGELKGKNIKVYLSFSNAFTIPDIQYIQLTNYATYATKKAVTASGSEFENAIEFEEQIPVRSLAEISLEKDTTWLQKKHYYIVNDEKTAEQIFQYLETYNGIISYDTETTGLCINMFGEIGSERKRKIDEENERLKAEGKAPYKVDRLVGIIFCVEENVSYYFPCFNRKFKNLYQDRNDEFTKKTIANIKARYIVGELRESQTNMANYIRNTPDEEWSCDVILMERVRKILETRWLGTHHGSFEYKVGLLYNIDTNIKDDSMLLHQLLYKFRNINSSNDRGEPSNLKYLTKVEFGIDQLDLKDFFVNYTEDETGLAKSVGKKGKGKKKKSNIDFSYMDYAGSQAYAPADGDFTLGLILKYKKGLLTEFKNQEYLYTVEIIVSCAIGYMEYYGHRLDERQIQATKVKTYTSMLMTEKKIRDLINANTEEEKQAFELLESYSSDFSKLSIGDEGYDEALEKLDSQNMLVRQKIDESANQLNLGSPAQVAELFYDRLNIPIGKDGVRSVSKRAIKPLSKARNEDMSLKYPVVKYYMDWKNDSTLLTKFFDNLPNYMYPGGFIFSGYGQITTATGRMSCICEGTNIAIPGGYKRIEDLHVGDYLYCYDDMDNLQISRLINLVDKSYEDCVEVKWHKIGSDDFDSLILTPDHKVKTYEGEWVEAAELEPGDKVINLRRGSGRNEQQFIEETISNCTGRLGGVYTEGKLDTTTCFIVSSVSPVGIHHVYDLQVEGYHNFIANGVEVKNCSKPNAQQYPHSVTCMVIPREGCVFADADYSQIEYRTMTAMAKEKSLMDKFTDPDMDYHTTMASLMFGVPYANVTGSMRSDAKTFNFGIPYGMGIKKLAFQLKGSEDAAAVEEAKYKYELYFKEQPHVRRFFEDVKEAARVYGYTETKWGRRRYYSFTDENGRIDSRKLGASLRQAGNCVIQGSAADIFKIGVARNFMFIRENNLFGKYFITNMVHDEQLVEISCDLNVQAILARLIHAMELHIDGFPPLYVGAGIGHTWDEAKGKMAEIHPILGREFVKEYQESNMGLWATDETRMTPDEVYAYFTERNYKFREKKILDYVLDESNYGQALHPVIGSLLGLQFDYGVKKDLKEKFPDGMEGISYTKEEREEAEKNSPLERLKRFIEAHELDIPIENFQAAVEDVTMEEEDTVYSDGEEEEEDLYDEDEVLLSSFKLLDESKEEYGCKLEDLTRQFGFFVSKKQRLLCIDYSNLTYKSQMSMKALLMRHICEEGERGALRVQLLNKMGQLKPDITQPQLYVKGITEDAIVTNMQLES